MCNSALSFFIKYLDCLTLVLRMQLLATDASGGVAVGVAVHSYK